MKPPDPKNLQPEICEFAGATANLWQVHDRQIVAELLVARDAFIVVQEVAATVKDRLAAVDLDALGMVGRMAMDDIEACPVDQPAREPLCCAGTS